MEKENEFAPGIKKAADAAIKQAKKVELQAAKLSKKISAEPNKMVVNLHFTNKKLKPAKQLKKK